MGIFDIFRTKGIDFDDAFDLDLILQDQEKVYMKRLALETCVNMIAKTISQSEFKMMEKGKSIRDQFYYRFNLRPNKNQTSSYFWQSVVHKMIHDNECLIIVTDDDELLIADDFERTEYALFEDTFSNVTARGYTYNRTFKNSQVIYLPYNNTDVTALVTELFEDYGRLFGRLLEFQMRKNQLRSIIDMEAITGKDEATQRKIQTFIDKVYRGIEKNGHVVIPQQKGFKYSEYTAQNATVPVDEINKVTDGFMDHAARAFGIPLALLRGEMADVENQTKNYMVFCINPLARKISDELNAKFVEREDYLDGKQIKIKTSSYESIFDMASNADKLVSSSLFTPNELREELGFERSDDPMLDKHLLTKNYGSAEDAQADPANAE